MTELAREVSDLLGPWAEPTCLSLFFFFVRDPDADGGSIPRTALPMNSLECDLFLRPICIFLENVEKHDLFFFFFSESVIGLNLLIGTALVLDLFVIDKVLVFFFCIGIP